MMALSLNDRDLQLWQDNVIPLKPGQDEWNPDLCTEFEPQQIFHSRRNEIAFIDPAVPGYETLRDGICLGIECVVLDPAEDGIAQMIEHLEDREDVAAIHIFGLGAEATLALGQATLSLATMSIYHDMLRALGRHMSVAGEILIYGSETGSGEAGAEFVSELADLTDCHVAAATRQIGCESLGGCWELDQVSGLVISALAIGADARARYDEVLALVATHRSANDLDFSHLWRKAAQA
ncbi:MAG: hypothetical protein Alpg2KO_29780 [Alphaproteobacteria bacterium]